MNRIRVRVTVIMFLRSGTPGCPFFEKSISGEYVFGDVLFASDGWEMGWCNQLPPYIQDGMLQLPCDVAGNEQWVPLDQIAGVIKVKYEKVARQESAGAEEKK